VGHDMGHYFGKIKRIYFVILWLTHAPYELIKIIFRDLNHVTDKEKMSNFEKWDFFYIRDSSHGYYKYRVFWGVSVAQVTDRGILVIS
jgi:hypothetical protein